MATDQEITTANADLTVISWDAREQLLERVRQPEGGEDVARRFQAVGATRPVTLDAAGKALLSTVLEGWLEEVGKDELPYGVSELRNALIDDRDRRELG
jgi:hypothetical protein